MEEEDEVGEAAEGFGEDRECFIEILYDTLMS